MPTRINWIDKHRKKTQTNDIFFLLCQVQLHYKLQLTYHFTQFIECHADINWFCANHFQVERNVTQSFKRNSHNLWYKHVRLRFKKLLSFIWYFWNEIEFKTVQSFGPRSIKKSADNVWFIYAYTNLVIDHALQRIRVW